ncbi:MAG: DNA polymerase III subunit delta' [Lactobacillaceae bacterium]|jgi:DNA polymerase-3 subunit delta'|nr:DNA polymerase III subunit delta' [Lactobacillaceae bacterium]
MTPLEIIEQANVQQPQLVKQLKQAVASHQLAHAFLFTGPRGRGQTIVADWLAMRLMCGNPTPGGEPDGTCSQCLRIASHEHPDVIEIEPDGNSIKVDQVRFLKDEFTKTAVEGRQKIFVIAGADTMTPSAANGLLKFIEEPVGEQTAILLAENRQQVLPTVISRTQVIDFPNLAPDEFAKQIAALGYADHQIELVAGLTDSLIVAEEWLVDDWFKQATDVIAALTTKILQLDPTAFNMVQTDITKLGGTPAQNKVLLAMLAEAWRDTLLLVDQDILNGRFVQATNWQTLGQKYGTAKLLHVQDLLLAAGQTMGLNISLQTTLEATILQAQFTLAGE